MRVQLVAQVPMAIEGSIRPAGTILLDGELMAGVPLDRLLRILEVADRGKIAWRPSPGVEGPIPPAPPMGEWDDLAVAFEPAAPAPAAPAAPAVSSKRANLLRGRGARR